MTVPNDEQRPQLDYMAKGTALFGGRSPQQMLQPFWLTLIGGVICCISFSITIKSLGHGNLDLRLSSRPIGAVLVAAGVWRLSRIDTDPEYTRLMRVIVAVAALQIVTTIADIFPPSNDPLVALFHIFIDLAVVAAAIAFCICVSWLCRDVGLGRSANAWRKTFIVFCVCSIPLVLLECTVLLIVLKILQVQPLAARGAKWSWSWWYMALVPFIVAPPLAYVLCIRQMGREMTRRVARHPGITVAVSPLLPIPDGDEVSESDPAPGV